MLKAFLGVCVCLCVCTFQITDATFIKNFLAKASPDAASGINNMGVHLSPKMQSWTSVKLWNVTYVQVPHISILTSISLLIYRALLCRVLRL